MGEGTMTTLEWTETRWDGSPAAATPEPGVTLVADTVTIEGAIEGTGQDRWLMSHAAAGTAEFVGLTEVTGSVNGRKGTCVLRHTGRMDGTGGLHADFTVVPGSGTGELEGLTGSGTVTFVPPAGPTRYTFEADASQTP